MKYNLNVGSLVLRRDITENGTREWLAKVVELNGYFDEAFIHSVNTKIKTFGFLKKFVKLTYKCQCNLLERYETYAICINKRLLQEFGFKPSETRADTMEYESKKWRIEIYYLYDTTPENVDKNKFLLTVYAKKESLMFKRSRCKVKYMHDIQAILRTLGCDCPKRLVRYVEPDEE